MSSSKPKAESTQRGASQIHVYGTPETRRMAGELALWHHRTISAEIQHLIETAYQSEILKREAKS